VPVECDSGDRISWGRSGRVAPGRVGSGWSGYWGEVGQVGQMLGRSGHWGEVGQVRLLGRGRSGQVTGARSVRSGYWGEVGQVRGGVLVSVCFRSPSFQS
jgi:ribosomal protein S28E/S33